MQRADSSETNIIQVGRWLENRARFSERKREWKEAIRYWALLLQRSTRDAQAGVEKLAAIHYRLGLAHRMVNNPSKAIYHLKYSVRLNASEPRYYDAFGRAFLSGGHWNIAKAQFEKAIKLAPENPIYVRQYAWVLHMMGRKDEALYFSEKALKMRPTSLESRLVFARILMDSALIFQALVLLSSIKRPSLRVRRYVEECREKLDATFEGLVLRLVRRGMRADGHPFHLKDVWQAEQIWMRYCLAHAGYPFEQSDPQVWAAAIICFVYHQKFQMVDFEKFLADFKVSSIQMWPCLKRLQETQAA